MRNGRVIGLLLVIIFSMVPLISPPAALAQSQPIDDALSWLLANQNPSGNWGEIIPLRDTPIVVEALIDAKPDSPNLIAAKVWLQSQETPNIDYLARKIKALSLLEVDTSTYSSTLLTTQNPDGGFGIADGYATDTLDTTLALDALKAAGMAGGLTVVDESITPGEPDTFQFELPGDATSLRIEITELTGAIDFRIKQGTPPTLADPYYQLTFAPIALSGLPVELGTNYIRIDSTVDSTYSFEVSYVADGFDTRDLLTPLNYLTQAQNPDGGWGITSGADSNIYLTAKILLTLESYSTFFDLQTNIDNGIAWLLTKQNIDGT